MSPENFVVCDDADDLLNEKPARRTRQRVPRVPREPSRAEATIQEACMKVIMQRGYAIVTTGGRFLVTGTPDIIACADGRFLAIEVKRVGEKPTPAQYGQLRRWQQVGALVGYVDHEDQIGHLLEHLDDPGWTNDLERPGDGR